MLSAFLHLSWLWEAAGVYPFDTMSGGPTCRVPFCGMCVVDKVEYSQNLDAPGVTRHKDAGAFWETELTGGLCCGDNCGIKNNGGDITQGYGICGADSSGTVRRTWACGLCEDARCQCRKVVMETIPDECFRCVDGYSVTPTKQCSPCPVDTKGDGISCIDVDRCADRTNNCDRHAICTKTGPGRFSCKCASGYTGSGESCSEVDPCSVSQHACHPMAICNKTGVNQVKCTCKPGYEGNGKYCQDINECAVKVRACGSNELCINSEGGFSCKPCHENCQSGCVGLGPDECLECKGFLQNRTCVTVCPRGTYPDGNKNCQRCHSECFGACTGPENFQCISCLHIALVSPNSTACVQECPAKYFEDHATGTHMCKLCSVRCPEGSFVSANCTSQEDLECSPCPAGSFCDGISAQECASGSYQPLQNQSSCLTCKSGHFCLGGSIAQMCSVGFISSEGQNRCQGCPAGQTANPAHTACEDADACVLANITCAEGSTCRSMNGAIYCERISASFIYQAERETVPSWFYPVIVVLLLVGCCGTVGFCTWRMWRRKKPRAQTPNEDLELSDLDSPSNRNTDGTSTNMTGHANG